jgi:membrane protease YdiL (CAAX protease family)
VAEPPPPEPLARGRAAPGPRDSAPAVAVPAADRRWGFGDVLIGLGLGQALSIATTLVVFAATGWTTSEDVPLWAGALLQIPLWIGWTTAVVLAGRKGRGVVDDFGVRVRAVDAPVGLAVGVLMQMVVLPLLYLPVLRLLDRSSDDLSAPARELTSKAQGAAGWIVLSLIVVVGAPIFEELFYRGLMLGALRKRGMGPIAAALACGAIFAAMHLQSLQFLGLFVLGTVLSLLVVRTDRLGPAIVAHAAFNATTVVVLYLTS